jgi:hypothetical protein
MKLDPENPTKAGMKNLILSNIAALALAGVGILSPVCASASVTLYTNAAAWQAAVASSVTEPFNSTGLQAFTSVTSTAGSIGAASGVLSGSVWKDDMYNNPVFHSITTFSYVPAQLIGAGAVWDTSPNGEGVGIDISLNGGSETVGHIGGIHGGFFGWTSSTPFNSFQLSIYFLPLGGGETFDMDNLQFAPVPEPSGALLVVLGMAGLGLGRRLMKPSTTRDCVDL